MRALVVVSLLACGCRQLLGLDDLPAGDASVDARQILDADPSKLAITHVTPAEILEGTGTEGRPAVIVVHGMHIVPGATVELSSHDFGGSPVRIDASTVQVSRDGTMLAFPYGVPVESLLDANARFRIDVTVSQQAGTEVVTQTLTELAGGLPVLEVVGLDELTGSNVTLAPGVHQFSRVDVASITATQGGPAGSGPLIIRATSAVSLAGTSSVNASGKTAGPGGGDGGAGGSSLGGAGEAGLGDGGGLPSGGGGSYATKGAGNSRDIVGDPALPTLDAPNRGSGGAGGNGQPPGGTGGAGGGGGGTIEITANGPIQAATIQARGGNGVVSPADDGGGGSGGTILLRSAIAVTASSLDVAGGIGLNAGGVGRIRIDAPQVPLATNPAFYRGPTFAVDTPSITTEAQPMLRLTGQPLSTFRYYFATADRAQLRGPFSATFSGAGTATVMPPEALYEGFNHVCALVEGADLERLEGRNCIEVVYLY